jgi:hypothetical protein
MIYFYIATVILLPTVCFDIRPSHPTPDLNGSRFSSLAPLFVFSSFPPHMEPSLTTASCLLLTYVRVVIVNFKAIALFAGTFLIAKRASE